MIGIHHRDTSINATTTNTTPEAPESIEEVENNMSPSSSDKPLDDPLQAGAIAQENDIQVETESKMNSKRTKQAKAKDTVEDQGSSNGLPSANAESPFVNPLSIPEDTEPALANTDNPTAVAQESQGKMEGSTDGAQPEGEAQANETQEPTEHKMAAPSEDQQQQPSQSCSSSQPQQESDVVMVKPKLKRPPLRPVDLDSVPKKSILKKESAYPFIEQPARNPIFKSQWLQSTVSKLAVMSGPATPTAYTGNAPSMFRKLVTQATAATMPPPHMSTGSQQHRPGGPPIFANNERPISFLEANDSTTSLLSDKALKRVRFSVGQLTTEHVFHHDDAYESAEESEQPRRVEIITTPVESKNVLTTTDGIVVDDNIYTAKEIMNYYLVACNNREEFPVDRLVSDMRIASSRPSNPLLTTIDLSDEQLPRKTLDPIADVLTLEFGLKHLILDNCGLEDDTLKTLLYSLLLTDTLTVLSLQDNRRIKSAGFKYISVFTKSLKSLNISGVTMEKKSIEFLAHALRIGRLGFGSRLEELRMDRCGLRGNLLEIMAPAIRESNLRQVSMRSNRIGPSGGVWIGVLMRDYDDQPNKTIPINNEEQGFKRVFPGIVNPELLKRTRGVEFLDVSDNDLRQGADYIAQTLRRNMSLKCLVLQNNNLDPARLVVFADALKLNIGLEALDLGYNRVSGPVITGINALTQKLSYNKTLTRLSLSNTNLQSEGAIALAEFLPETRTLTQLDLTGNEMVDIAGVMALSVSIRMNKSLTCLDMNVPPNDAEFARLSRDILRACIRNMEDKTGSNAGMPSGDDMPTNTIFHQPSPTLIPAPSAPSIEDDRWLLLEAVAGELYRTRETLNAMERALNHEKALRRSWLDQYYRRLTVEVPIASNDDGGDGEHPQQYPPIAPIVNSPHDKRMLDITRGILYRGPPLLEQLYHQCKRHQANIMHFNARVDNERALNELESMNNVINAFLQAYRILFALPEMPANIVLAKRTNSLPLHTPVEAPGPNSGLSQATNEQNQEQPQVSEGLGLGSVQSLDQDHVVPGSLTDGPTEDMESSFLLEDEDDMDDEDYTNDELIDARRSSLLADRLATSTIPIDDVETERELTYKGRGLKPSPLRTTDEVSSTDNERSPSILASPLEKLRKAAEEEEGEILRRGKDLLENELENGVVDDDMSGEELKVQILAGDSKT
ncbi:hypothetical protein BGZ51_008890 [Haplosporangium sp. Z 767]|nr:hypothetical protein BGZ51_008890 [Haplosporangium sp. Z 767]KAF9192375.1 hypothetical protein BGZ50_008638 [Haplosporangium sp. Z 11]